jgi:hypothetical protein
MITLVTLGACCSTTAAATAGVGLVAQASGSSSSNLLLNNWFLGVFQVVVVYVALIAQELLLRMYGSLFASSDPGFSANLPSPRPLDRRALVAAVLRAAVLAAGVTWALSVLADWTIISPTNASGALWFNWVVEHWLVGGFAVFAALSPHVVLGWARSWLPTSRGTPLRAVLLLGAWTLGGWVPPPLSGMGVEGFCNEVLGALGAPTWLGAVAPTFVPGLALAFQWAFQYLLLALFVGAVAAFPRRTSEWLAGSSPELVAGSVTEPTGPTVSGPLGLAR